MRTRMLLPVLLLVAAAAACSGNVDDGPKIPKVTQADLKDLAIVLYYVDMPQAEARALYDKLVGLGMRDYLFEPELGTGGPRAIMYRAERKGQAEWLRDHVPELKGYTVKPDESATDIFINTY